MFRVASIADIHLTGGFNTDEAEALLRAADLCVYDSVSAVLVNGDVYHSKSTPEQRLVFLEFLHRLTSAGIQVVVLRGNHDERHDLEVFSPMDDVYVFEEPGEAHLCIRGTDDILAVHTIPHFNASKLAFESESLDRMGETGSNCFEDIIEGIRQSIAGHGRCSMVAFHGTVSGAMLDNGMIPKCDGIELNGELLSSLDVPVRGGHYHLYQEVAPNVVYSGSITLRNYGESGDKGFVVDTWNGQSWEPHEFISLEPAKRITVEAEWITQETDGDPYFYIISDELVSKEILYPKLEDLFCEVFKNARVRFRYKVKQSELASVDVEPVKRFFEEAGVREIKLEKDLIIESAVRSESILKATTTVENLKAWYTLKGLETKIPRQLEVYNEVCGDGALESAGDQRHESECSFGSLDAGCTVEPCRFESDSPQPQPSLF